MVFNSISFLVFFSVFFLLYWVVNRKFSLTVRNIYILVASYIFYGWWDWRFLSLIIISSLSDYILGNKIHLTDNPKNRKQLLILSLVVNLGMLGFFKYFNFFVDSFSELFSLFGLKLNNYTLRIILPVGISFYTFQTMSYTIDIYYKRLKPTKDIFAFFAFVAFFPQLVAGPIERASHLLKQFSLKKDFDYNEAVAGLRIVLWGLFKKIVIADNFAIIVDYIFKPGFDTSAISTGLGLFLFSFQIYCDFSGYSDIAIGISRMLGFNLMTNFQTPYFSNSIGEFWRRWHISLSTWFRDYVYIPLGGNRNGKLKANKNLLITFLVSGLWHGANLTFILWGFLHGFALIVEKLLAKGRKIKIPSLLVFIIVTLFWLPFRAQNISHLIALIKSFSNFEVPLKLFNKIVNFYSEGKIITLSITFIAFVIIEFILGKKDFNLVLSGKSVFLRYSVYYVILMLILILGNFDLKPSFIYFQF